MYFSASKAVGTAGVELDVAGPVAVLGAVGEFAALAAVAPVAALGLAGELAALGLAGALVALGAAVADCLELCARSGNAWLLLFTASPTKAHFHDANGIGNTLLQKPRAPPAARDYSRTRC
ncbi:hypothetical protein ACU21_04140 [Actinobaculum suis]|nr:hypothetical protein ACU20_05920 [Actinobaculum suis]OCA95485.1 hypothetical protein ACU21_04140 [Actinobaculum suis]